MPAGFLLKCFPTASNRDNARATIPLAAAAQAGRRNSQDRRISEGMFGGQSQTS
nr:MAG TPA: hypothetical protein [Caudoviricetes sp.]